MPGCSGALPFREHAGHDTDGENHQHPIIGVFILANVGLMVSFFCIPLMAVTGLSLSCLFAAAMVRFIMWLLSVGRASDSASYGNREREFVKSSLYREYTISMNERVGVNACFDPRVRRHVL